MLLRALAFNLGLFLIFIRILDKSSLAPFGHLVPSACRLCSSIVGFKWQAGKLDAFASVSVAALQTGTPNFLLAPGFVIDIYLTNCTKHLHEHKWRATMAGRILPIALATISGIAIGMATFGEELKAQQMKRLTEEYNR
jgi:hypothetical protein